MLEVMEVAEAAKGVWRLLVDTLVDSIPFGWFK